MDLKFFSGKKVLLTGATGFKGSWLAIILNELGAEVYDYSLPPTTENANFNTCQLASKINSQFGDIRDYDGFYNYISSIQPELVFHLAAQSLVSKSYIDSVSTYDTNLMGTVNLIDIIRKVSSIKQAILITTDKCYQNNETGQDYKETDALGGHDPYSASKACAELAIQSSILSFFQEDETCNLASARAGNVIGAGDWAEDRIVPDIFRSIITKSNLELRAPASIRPWQHVLEPLFGYLTLAVKLAKKGKSFQGAWNFGPKIEKSYSVEDLAKAIQKLEPRLEYKTQGASIGHEAKNLNLSIDKAKQELNWQPVLDFNETIKYTVEGYLDELLNTGNLYKARTEQIQIYIKKLTNERNFEQSSRNKKTNL